jgi:hypothetical protein
MPAISAPPDPGCAHMARKDASMPIEPVFTKIFAGIASREEMFALLNEPVDAPLADRFSGQAYAGRWFETDADGYREMLEVLPPLRMSADMFILSEFKAGTVVSAFFEIVIGGRRRWFHGYCDTCDSAAPDALRNAIVLWETGDTSAMTRTQRLDAIWSTTHADYRGIAGEHDPQAWPEPWRGKRTILVYEPGVGTVLKPLEMLTDGEVAERMRRFGAAMRTHAPG